MQRDARMSLAPHSLHALRTGRSGRRRLVQALLLGILFLSMPVHAARGQNPIPRAAVHARALVRSALVEGPRHSFQAVVKKPLRYIGMVVAIGSVGAGAKMLGVDAEPFAIALSAGATTYAAWKAWPALLASEGVGRTRLVGRELVWPVSLSAGTSILGHLTGGGSAAHAITAKTVAKAGVQAAVIGFDVPTIVQTVLDQDQDQHQGEGGHR